MAEIDNDSDENSTPIAVEPKTPSQNGSNHAANPEEPALIPVKNG